MHLLKSAPMRAALALVLAAGCAVDPSTPPPDDVVPVDLDEDGIDDHLEDQLMQQFGPEIRLAPDAIDWTRPANVDWYLPQVQMRFDHPGCPDDGILELGAISFDTIHAQTHFTKASGTGLCKHNGSADDMRSSAKKHLDFFLQSDNDDAVHPGIPPERAAEWRSYIQVRPSGYVRADGVAAAYDLQVWFFYAYNDFVVSANHEADWEHMTISITEDLQIASVFYATHDAGHRIDDMSQLAFVEDTHVVGYAADGSHATYETPGTHAGPVVDDHAYDGGPVWHTWDNFSNLGQVGHVLNGQTWALYGGRWGEVGQTDFTSGPPGPMFNGKWDTKNEYPKP